MADDGLSYLLEIVAKLRDEASPGIDKLKAKIDELKATNDAESAEKDLGKAVEDTGRKTDDSRRKREALRAENEKGKRASEDASRGTRDLAKDVDDLGKSHDNTSDKTNVNTKAQEDHADALARVRKESRETSSGIKDLDERMDSLLERSTELNEKSFIPGDTEGLNKQREAWADLDRQIKSVSNSYSRLATSRKEGEDGLRSEAIHKAEEGFLEAAQARAEAERLQKLTPASRHPLSVDTTEEVKQLKAIEDEENAQKDLELQLSKTKTAWDDFQSSLNRGELSKGEASRGLKEFSSEFSTLSRKLETGGQDWKDTESTLDRIGSKLKNTDLASTGGLFRSFARSGQDDSKPLEFLEAIDSKVGDLGVRITGVSSALRGFFDLAKIGLSQQLITGVISLAGGLVAVGSAAAQAGAALAGAFISGLGQAIPMLSIVAAAALRFKNILQAVSVAEQAEQQHFYDPTEKQVLQLQQTSQLVSAQQQLSNSYIELYEAQQRVRDSQIALTEARYTASRQTKELAMDEKDAKLEAEGANLSLVEARRQLQIDIQKGTGGGASLQQAELAVKQAELSKEKAEYAIPKAEREARLARERGIGGEPAVISAREGLEGAKVAQLQAIQAGEAAKRQEQITELQEQARSSKETTYESQEKFLKKGMSPTELGLTDALIGIEKELRSPESPLKKITDYFVEPFTNAVERIRSLLKNTSFLEPIDNLAKAMGAGLGRLEKSTYGGEGTDFFESMAKDATENIPVVSQAIERIMKLFEDIAKAADPAFHRLSEDWDKFWGELDRKYEGNGLEKLTDFFNKSVGYAESFARLGKAVIDLFMALGHDAAPQGLDTVNSLTGAIKSATEWVQSHGPQVTKFFREAREGLSLIGNMLGAIGLSLIKVFSVSSLSAFSGFIQQVLLPGLRNVVTVLGFATTKVLDVFDAFGNTGRIVLETIGTIIALGVALAKIVAIFKSIIAFISEMKVAMGELDFESILLNPWIAVAAVIGGAAYALGLFSNEQKKVKISTEEINSALERQEEALRNIKDLNDEYKSSELSVKEAKTQVASAEQSLARARREPASPGETAVERKLRIESDEQQLSRSKITSQERQTEFTRLPEKQAETLQKESRESQKAIESNRTRSKQLNEELHNLEKERKNQETFANSPAFKGQSEEREAKQEVLNIDSKVVKKNEELKQSQENLAKATKTGNEVQSSSTATAMRLIVDGVNNGIGAINKILGSELKSLFTGKSPTKGSTLPTLTKIPGLAEGLAGHATGAYVPAASGGHIARVGEGGHDEVVLTTDPAHAPRQRELLGHFLRAAPHMAKGGAVGEFNKQYGGTHLDRLLMAVDKVSNANFPYRLGGGHENPAIFGAFDCSGFIDYVTQQAGYKVPSTVSGDIGSWGFPSGEGLATIFYNPVHTFMRAGGRYAGTSGFARKKDKGGAGWFEESPNAGYLSGFSTVHLPDVEGKGAWTSSAKFLENYGQQLTDKGLGSTARAFAAATSSAAGNVKNAILESPAFQEIISPKIKGGGVIGKVGQNALNLATNAANIYLAKMAGAGSGAEGSYGPLSGGNVGSEVMNFFTGHDLTKIAAAGITGNFQQESSLDPNAPGGGLDQGQGARNFSGRSLAGQLAGIYGELTSDEKGTLEALQKAKTPAEAARIFSERFERPSIPDLSNREHYAEEAYQQYATGGLIGDSVRRLAIRHLRKKVLKFASGGKAPWGGNPVPIIAHEGERIMNPAQYHETARLAGTSPGGLDRHLGYDSSPRQHFADGGVVVPPKIKNPGGSAQANSLGGSSAIFLSNISEELSSFNSIFTEPGSSQSIKKITKIFKVISEGFKKLKTFNKDSEEYANEVSKFVKTIIEESTGVLAQLKVARESVKTKLEQSKVESAYSDIIPSSKPGVRVKGPRESLGVIENLKTIKLGSGGEASVEESEVKNLAQEGREMAKESNLISSSLADVKKSISAAHKIKNSGKRSTAINTLTKEYDELALKQKELVEEMNSNIEARYQAETQVLQDKITETNNQYQAVSQEQTTKITSAQALGNLGEVGKLEEQSSASAQEQISKLQPLLAEANKIGNKELEASLKQEISSLNQTINSALTERISNAQTLIQRETAQAEAKSGERLGISKVLAQEGKYEAAGREEKAGLQEKQTNLISTKEKEVQLKEQALREGDTAAAITLGEELNKNNVEIAENNLALKNNATVTRELIVSQIEATGQFKSGIYSALTQGIETIGKTTGYMNVGGLLGAAKGREGAYGTERSELEGQASGIGIGVNNMSPAELLTYLASPAGQSKISQLENNAVSKEEKESIYKLVDALETNATNTLKNAEEIAKLNGELNQPQSWSTSAQQAFRQSVFNGMGNLLPQYSAALPAGARPTEMPVYGEQGPGSAGGGPAIGTLSLTHPVEKLDPSLLGEEMLFHIQNTPSMS